MSESGRSRWQRHAMRRAKGPNPYQPWATPKDRAPTISSGPTARPMPPASPWRINGRHHRKENAGNRRSSCRWEGCLVLATSRTRPALSSSRQPGLQPQFYRSRRWGGLSALFRFGASVLGRCPRLGWRRAVGALGLGLPEHIDRG
jgi:hypothetical protein